MSSRNRGGRKSASLTRLVLETYGDRCWLRLPGCTGLATTKDHVTPYSLGGDDSIENLRPACRSCNSKRQNRVVAGGGARVVVVIGPPAAGKTTYVREHAEPWDITIDLDAIARALMPNPPAATHVYPAHVRHVAIGARKAALDRATRIAERCTVWIIQAIPTPDQLREYRGYGWGVITIDPGRAVVEQRARTQRPPEIVAAIDRWYELAKVLAPVPAASNDEPPGTQLVSASSPSPREQW